MPTTKGEYRIGVSFNPSQKGIVDDIKKQAADLINLIETIPPAHGTNRGMEVARLKALAQTEVESAAMWAVKAATKGDPRCGLKPTQM